MPPPSPTRGLTPREICSSFASHIFFSNTPKTTTKEEEEEHITKIILFNSLTLPPTLPNARLQWEAEIMGLLASTTAGRSINRQ